LYSHLKKVSSAYPARGIAWGTHWKKIDNPWARNCYTSREVDGVVVVSRNMAKERSLARQDRYERGGLEREGEA
jgi:hypothetical protein